MVKNVTGYDLPKLMAGSWGRLAAMTELTAEGLPASARERHDGAGRLGRSAGHRGHGPRDGQPFGRLGRGPSAAGVAPGRALTLLRLQGFERSVEARCGEAAGSAAASAAACIDSGSRSRALVATRSARQRHSARSIRCGVFSVPPSCAPRSFKLWSHSERSGFSTGPAALIWLTLQGNAVRVRAAAALPVGTRAWCVRRGIRVTRYRRCIRQSAAVNALEARIRRAFDPAGVFETARFLD